MEYIKLKKMQFDLKKLNLNDLLILQNFHIVQTNKIRLEIKKRLKGRKSN